MPFGAGPRVCIGASFASIEMQIITVMMLSRFHITADDGHEMTPDVGLTLRPRGGVRLRLAPLERRRLLAA